MYGVELIEAYSLLSLGMKGK